jgi:hypothetical protein
MRVHINKEPTAVQEPRLQTGRRYRHIAPCLSDRGALDRGNTCDELVCKNKVRQYLVNEHGPCLDYCCLPSLSTALFLLLPCPRPDERRNALDMIAAAFASHDARAGRCWGLCRARESLGFWI